MCTGGVSLKRNRRISISEISINAFDTSNQPYIFCFEKFYETYSEKLNDYLTI